MEIFSRMPIPKTGRTIPQTHYAIKRSDNLDITPTIQPFRSRKKKLVSTVMDQLFLLQQPQTLPSPPHQQPTESETIGAIEEYWKYPPPLKISPPLRWGQEREEYYTLSLVPHMYKRKSRRKTCVINPAWRGRHIPRRLRTVTNPCDTNLWHRVMHRVRHQVWQNLHDNRYYQLQNIVMA